MHALFAPLAACVRGLNNVCTIPHCVPLISRFLDAAGHNVKTAAQQAQRTHEWRCSRGVDTVFCRPCPCYSLLLDTFPTYTLLEQNADGHAVLLTKVCRSTEELRRTIRRTHCSNYLLGGSQATVTLS